MALHHIKLFSVYNPGDVLNADGEYEEYILSEYLLDFEELLTPERVKKFMNKIFYDRVTRVEIIRE